MKFEFKILYKDESGNLDLGKNIGKCNLYVFNDGDKFRPSFWVISKSKKLIKNYSLIRLNFNEDYYWIYHNKYTNRSINLLKSDQEKIFEYIKKMRIDNNRQYNIWSDMLYAHDSYFGMKYFDKFTLNGLDINKYISNHDILYDIYICKNIDFGNRLGECSLEVTNIFPHIGAMFIQSKKIGFNSIISSFTGDYIGLDKLTDSECVILYDFMNSQNDHFGTHKMWYEIISNCYLSDFYLTRDEYFKFIEIMKNANLEDIPRFDLRANKSNIIDTNPFENKLKEILGGYYST